jgi:hypothetical protein
MRREVIVVVGLSEVLQNVNTLFHEPKDIGTGAILWENDETRSKRKGTWESKGRLAKHMAREKVLAKTINSRHHDILPRFLSRAAGSLCE